MNDTQIRCFIHAASEKNFTRAAEALNLSQPTVSRYLRMLEEELQCELLRRSTKKVELTEAGEYYLHLFLSWRMDLEAAHKYVNKIAAASYTVLKLGYSEDWDLTGSFRQVCDRLNFDRPEIGFDLFCFGHGELYGQLLSQSIDLALMINSPMLADEHFDYKKVASVEKILVYSENHPLAKQQNLTVEDFAHSIFYLVKESASFGAKAIRKAMKQYHFEPQFQTMPNIQSLLANVRNGLGVFVSDEWVIGEKGSAYRSIPLNQKEDVYLFWDKIHCRPETLALVGTLAQVQ